MTKSAERHRDYPGKRLFDLVTALFALILGAPFLAAAALAIRWDSPGPALFRQTRVGRDQRPFTCFKLRTMRLGTDSAPTHTIAAAAVTPVGRWLRRTKIDELPQLWNVIRGEMSLVGPRPCLPSQNELITARERLGVFAMPPGITGLAQIRGIDMSDPEVLAAVDAEYCEKPSLLTDVRLILKTAAGNGRQDNTDPSRGK